MQEAGRDRLGVGDPREVGEPVVGVGVARAIEVLEYELVLDGVPKEMMPDQADGTYRVWQAIDHGVPGRFRFASYTADGRMLTSIAEDPLREAARRSPSRRKGSPTGST